MASDIWSVASTNFQPFFVRHNTNKFGGQFFDLILLFDSMFFKNNIFFKEPQVAVLKFSPENKNTKKGIIWKGNKLVGHLICTLHCFKL